MPALSDPTIVVSAASAATVLLDEDDSTNGVNGVIAKPAEALEGSALKSPLPSVEARDQGAQTPHVAPPQLPLPLPPVVIPKRLVRGRYRSTSAGFHLDLRVDVDGTRPLRRVSGDFFSVSGATTSYFGSFVVNAPTITTTNAQVSIEGLGSFTWSAGAPYVRVSIPRVSVLSPPGASTVQFITPPSTPGATYLCNFNSQYFRTVAYEQDSVAGAVPFISYDTGSLPQPSGTPPGR